MTSKVRFENGDGKHHREMQIPATIIRAPSMTRYVVGAPRYTPALTAGPTARCSGDLREVVSALRLSVPSPVVRAKRQETDNDKSQP